VPIRIGGWVDHVHLLVKLKTTHRLSDFMRELKATTSKHFNQTSGKLAKFGWQDGYGAFTVSAANKEDVIKYIENQVRHHADESFQDEYLRMLEMAGIQYDERFLWD
jgi:REP element-mobilizing transposase RayT